MSADDKTADLLCPVAGEAYKFMAEFTRHHDPPIAENDAGLCDFDIDDGRTAPFSDRFAQAIEDILRTAEPAAVR